MIPTVGIFTSRKDAEQAIEHLQSVGIPPDQVSLLSPGTSKEEIHDVPTSESEQPGMGKAMGGVVGGALGMQLGAALSMVIPGIGPVIATGLVATALLGVIGAVSGAAATPSVTTVSSLSAPRNVSTPVSDPAASGVEASAVTMPVPSLPVARTA